MFQLPLFPLNTVLFPGMPLHLHIFEPRYRHMVQTCMAGDQTFGVVLIRQGVEALGPLAEPHGVGCTAHIVETMPLGGNRMNLAAVGQERFRIHELDRNSEPYLVGKVEYYPLKVRDAQTLEEQAEKLRPWVGRYLEDLARASKSPSETADLPGEALPLIYLGAILLMMPAGMKQSFLEAEYADDLADNLLGHYRRELGLLSAMLATDKGEKAGPFSMS